MELANALRLNWFYDPKWIESTVHVSVYIYLIPIPFRSHNHLSLFCSPPQKHFERTLGTGCILFRYIANNIYPKVNFSFHNPFGWCVETEKVRVQLNVGTYVEFIYWLINFDSRIFKMITWNGWHNVVHLIPTLIRRFSNGKKNAPHRGWFGWWFVLFFLNYFLSILLAEHLSQFIFFIKSHSNYLASNCFWMKMFDIFHFVPSAVERERKKTSKHILSHNIHN